MRRTLATKQGCLSGQAAVCSGPGAVLRLSAEAHTRNPRRMKFFQKDAHARQQRVWVGFVGSGSGIAGAKPPRWVSPALWVPWRATSAPLCEIRKLIDSMSAREYRIESGRKARLQKM